MPCYYNAQNLPHTFEELSVRETELEDLVELQYVFVDDGSKDATLDVLHQQKSMLKGQVKIIKLARNFGAYNAVLAGLNYDDGDCTVVLAADLQDPPELIHKMLQRWQSGFKFVIANREDREEPFFQKLISGTFHKLMRRHAIRHIPPGGYDLVLFDKQIREQVVKMDEQNAHLLYLMSWLGYEYVTIPYTRRKREIGKSRWTFSKKLKLFIDSFVSFSFFPIRALSVAGLVLGGLALLYGLFIIIARVAGWVPIQGWSTLMVVLLFVSAFQMIGLGILGEYIWRALDAARNRPNFIVDKIWEPEDQKK